MRHVRRAETMAREVMEADPDNAQALFVLAFIRASRGNIPTIIAFAERAHQREPANPDVLPSHGNYSALGRAEETLRYGRQTLDVDPLHADESTDCRLAHLITGDAARAGRHFQDGERLAQGDPVFSLFAGLADWYLGETESARSRFERAGAAEGFRGLISEASSAQ